MSGNGSEQTVKILANGTKVLPNGMKILPNGKTWVYPNDRRLVWPNLPQRDALGLLLEETYIKLGHLEVRYSYLISSFLNDLKTDLWIKGSGRNSYATKEKRQQIISMIDELIGIVGGMHTTSREMYDYTNKLLEILYSNFNDLYRKPVSEAPKYFSLILNKSTPILKFLLQSRKGGRTRSHKRRGLKSRRRNRK